MSKDLKMTKEQMEQQLTLLQIQMGAHSMAIMNSKDQLHFLKNKYDEIFKQYRQAMSSLIQTPNKPDGIVKPDGTPALKAVKLPEEVVLPSGDQCEGTPADEVPPEAN